MCESMSLGVYVSIIFAHKRSSSISRIYNQHHLYKTLECNQVHKKGGNHKSKPKRQHDRNMVATTSYVIKEKRKQRERREKKKKKKKSETPSSCKKNTRKKGDKNG